MVRATAVVLAILLAGCAKAPTSVDKAQADYEFLQAHGASKIELCEASRKVVAAMAEAHDGENYGSRKLTSDIECRSAQSTI